LRSRRDLRLEAADWTSGYVDQTPTGIIRRLQRQPETTPILQRRVDSCSTPPRLNRRRGAQTDYDAARAILSKESPIIYCTIDLDLGDEQGHHRLCPLPRRPDPSGGVAKS